MQKITPFLWFNDNAEEAVTFYTSIFPNSRIVSTIPGPGGSVQSVIFELDGRPFYALNGGPHYKLTPAFSLFVNCETQAEVDDLWNRLSAGGSPNRCGWLTDKFGLSWQIIPSILGRYLHDKDPEKATRVMEAMLKMEKIDIKGLQDAYGQ